MSYQSYDLGVRTNLVPPAHVHHGIDFLRAVQRLFQPLAARLVDRLEDLGGGGSVLSNNFELMKV